MSPWLGMAMRRALLCCLLVGLTACARGTTAPPTAGPISTIASPSPATAAPTSAVGAQWRCPEALPVQGVVGADGARRALAPGEPGYGDLPWVACFPTTAAAGAAGFGRPVAGAAGAATPVLPMPTAVADDGPVVVVRVIDGQTIEVRLPDGRTETVRYLGVDAPGAADSALPDACAGAEALARHRALVEGRTVRLERDRSDSDRFERRLRYVWLVGDAGAPWAAERLVNAELVRAGLAAAAVRPPDEKYRQLILDAEREAQGARAGLWVTCAATPVPPPPALPTPAPTQPAPAPTPTPRPPTPPPASGFPAAPPPPPTATAPAVPPTVPAPPAATAPPALPTPTPRAAPTQPAPPPPTATRPPPTPTRVPPTRTPAPSCHPSYPTVCIPPPPPDLDCADIPYRNFPVRPPDPHRFDGDKDGIGCEQ